MSKHSQEVVNLYKALDLALIMLFNHEPGDSRFVSSEFVALSAVASGYDNQECWKVIDEAIDNHKKLMEKENV